MTKWQAGRGNIRAHIASWKLHHGPFPRGFCVCHHCDNPPCVRPSHLFLDTIRGNTEDMIRKGRGLVGVKNGHHKLTEEDVSIIRMERASGATLNQLAERFGVDFSNISKICLGKQWTHI
jgi:hypothetical protein